MQGTKPIYLDYNATTPLDPRTLDIMLPYLQQHFGNSVSSQHAWGWTAQGAIEKARGQIANLIGSKPKEIFFTSGATESNNWVLQSMFKPGVHILTSAVEHSSIMATAEYLKGLGADIETVPVNKYGQVEIEEVAKRIRPDTALMSFMWVNNEVGSVNPIPELCALAKQKGILFHSDATQALDKFEINLSQTPIDFLTLSSHKMYGPKGIGALFIRSPLALRPLIHGGSQERGFRAGTLSVSNAVGFGHACEITSKEMNIENTRMAALRESFVKELTAEIPGIQFNGHPTQRSCTNFSLTFPTSDLDHAAPHLMKIGFSSGSACHSGSGIGSHVLKAMGLTTQEINRTIRLSVGRFTTYEELHETVSILKKAFAPIEIHNEFQQVSP